jgi:hypothetical protein
MIKLVNLHFAKKQFYCRRPKFLKYSKNLEALSYVYWTARAKNSKSVIFNT